MEYFLVNSLDHYEMYAGDKKIVDGKFYISIHAKKTIPRRIAWLSKSIKNATAHSEHTSDYKHTLSELRKNLADGNTDIPT